MDHFGIGNTIRSTIEVCMGLARRTGRTTLLLNTVRNGDRVIFRTCAEAKYFENLCNDRGIAVECIVVGEARAEHMLLGRKPPKSGRTICDHTWVEQQYIDAIASVRDRIDKLEEDKGAFDRAMEERELSKDAKNFSAIMEAMRPIFEGYTKGGSQKSDVAYITVERL